MKTRKIRFNPEFPFGGSSRLMYHRHVLPVCGCNHRPCPRPTRYSASVMRLGQMRQSGQMMRCVKGVWTNPIRSLNAISWLHIHPSIENVYKANKDSKYESLISDIKSLKTNIVFSFDIDTLFVFLISSFTESKVDLCKMFMFSTEITFSWIKL